MGHRRAPGEPWRAADRAAATGCGLLALALLAGTAKFLRNAFSACGDPRHRCAFAPVGAALFAGLAGLCVLAAYALWGRRAAGPGGRSAAIEDHDPAA